MRKPKPIELEEQILALRIKQLEIFIEKARSSITQCKDVLRTRKILKPRNSEVLKDDFVKTSSILERSELQLKQLFLQKELIEFKLKRLGELYESRT